CPARWSSTATRRRPSRPSSGRAAPRGRPAPPRRSPPPCPPTSRAPSAARSRPGASACGSPPLERSLPPDVAVGQGGDEDEEKELDEAERRELVEDHRQRIQEDDLDVEDDEEHRRQVEADREPAPLGPALGGARLSAESA